MTGNHIPACVILCIILMIVALAVLDPDHGLAALTGFLTSDELFLALD